MEANRDVNQVDEEVRTESQSELQADSCRECDSALHNDMRPGTDRDDRPCGGRQCGMRPGMRPGNGRPGGMGPGGRPGGIRPGSVRPGGMQPGNGRPCGMRPGDCNGSGRPGAMMPGNTRPGSNRPCGERPCGNGNGVRPGNGLPNGWRPSDGMRSNSIMDEMDLHSEWNCGNRMIQDSDGRSMMVGCEGQTMSGCHMNDPMERLGEAFPNVMAFVPWQQWGDMYTPEQGLKQGTIFRDLNYIFCGTRC